jgi:predicted Zn-dependent peptidase
VLQSHKFSLSNGLRVIVIPQKESPSITVAVLVQAGAAYEKKSNNGISHFLEHMCFKGTPKRPRPIDISSEFETLGASYNAFTSRDLTGYWAKAASLHTREITDLLSDMYLNPLFDKQEIEKEKGVIVEEINMYEDQPRAKVSQILERLMYGNQPAGWDVAGPKENIIKMTKNDFLDYRKNHYVTPKTFVVIAGNTSLNQAKELSKKYFSQVPKGKKIKSSGVKDRQAKPAVALKFKELDQTHFMMAFKAFSLFDERRYILALLADILGGGMSSRLFQKVREDLGAAYYVGSSANLYATHGFMDIFAGVNHAKTDLAIKAVIGELRDIAKNGVNSGELARVKEHRIGTFLLSLETSSDLAFYYGEQEVTMEKSLKPEQVIKKVKSVTKDQVARLARQILQNKGLNFAVVGPYRSSGRFKKLLYL